MRITRIGGPTAFIEWGGWRILTDPTFDAPGRRYGFALGTSSEKTRGPALPLSALEPVHVALVSHHHHADNLDDAGRAALEHADTVVTTRKGAADLAHHDIRGLKAGESIELTAPDRPRLRITATPCRHGPPLTGPIVGPVVGFALTLDDAPRPGVWMTGDTVLHAALRTAARGMRPEVLLLHLGRVRFSETGPLTYTMDAADGAELIALADPDAVVPLHVEGWSHFSQQEAEARAVLADAAPAVATKVRWLAPGEPTEVG